MRLAIMQPYLLPYIGYFQLMSAVDVFVVYDNIKYTKKGWISRNRLLSNGKDATFSLPLRADSDQCYICQRQLAETYMPEKLSRQFAGAYQGAPFFKQTQPLLNDIFNFEDKNLFAFLNNSILKTARHCGLAPNFVKSSEVDIDHNLKGQDKVLAICKYMGAKTYINSVGGKSLYDCGTFRQNGINLLFLQSKSINYSQFGAPFVPWLSIADVLMFNPIDQVQAMAASNFELN